ncbi:MAG: protein kinase, partial [Gemmataceae bacterium]|nr:protein kinase [Gemmataceae bacterium]
SRLVRETGPLPAGPACAHVAQAALGLQHAHERGLVHRDIKPANLLLAADGTVKILDMGLARMLEAGGDLTAEGAVMGTPDFIAPEQAEESHGVDIRADIYSLGCTLYFLLAGRVPFPGGTLMQKMRKHATATPDALEGLRPDVPAALCAVVRKMMAKRPEDRYQAPAQAAAALAPFSGIKGPPPRAFPVAASPEAETMPSAAAALADVTPPGLGKPGKPPRWPWLAVAAALVLAAGLLLWPRKEPEALPEKEKPPEPLPELKLPPEQQPYDQVPLLVGVMGEHRASHPDLAVIAADPTGKLVALAGHRHRMIRIARLDTMRREFDLWRTETSHLSGMAFSPDGKTLAGTALGGLLLFSLETPQAVPRIIEMEAYGTPSFSPDGKSVFVWGKEAVERVDLPAGKRSIAGKVQDLPGAQFFGFALSRDGSMLAVLTRTLTPTVDVARLALWSSDGKPLRALETQRDPEGKERRPYGAAFSPDGRTVYAWTDGFLFAWEAATGKALPLARTGFAASPDYPLQSPDGQRFAVVRNSNNRTKGYATFFDLNNIAEPKPLHTFLTALTVKAAWHPDGKRLLIADEMNLRVHDPATKKEPPELGPQSPTLRLLANPASGAPLTLSANSEDVWEDGQARTLPRVWAGFGPAEFSPDGAHFLGRHDAPRKWLDVFATKGWTAQYEVPGYPLAASFIAMKPRVRIAAIDREKAITLWELDQRQATPVGEAARLDTKDLLKAAWFAPEGKHLLATVVEPATGVVPRLEQFGLDGKRIGHIAHKPSAVVFARKGDEAFIGTSAGEVWRCDLSARKPAARRIHGWHSGAEVEALALTADGKHLVSADSAARVMVWKLGAPATEPRGIARSRRGCAARRWS